MMEIITKRSRMKWVMTLLFSLTLVVQSVGSSLAAASDSIAGSNGSPAFSPEMQQALSKAERILIGQEQLTDWEAVGLALNGREVPESYLRQKADEFLDNRGRYAKVGDLAAAMIGYTAAGGNVSFIAGLDLYPVLMNHPSMEKEGALGLALAYAAGNNSMSGTLARTEWYPDLILYRLLDLQSKDGSWSLADGGKGSVEATALALTALTAMPDSEQTQHALAWLKAQQMSDGGFGSTSATALAIIALSAHRIDSASLAGSEGLNPLEQLLSRQAEGGGFSEVTNGGMNRTATLQAYVALAVYKKFTNNDLSPGSMRYRPSEGSAGIEIEGPESTIAQGRIGIGDALESALKFLEAEGFSHKLQTDAKGGKTIESIAGIRNGQYGGQDRWRLAVRSKFGTWMFPENAPEGLKLSDGDQLLLYYGSDNTAVLDTVVVEWKYENQVVSGSPLAANSPVQLYVKKANRQLGYLPAQGVTVQLGGKTAVSDKQGKVSFDGLPSGIYRITVTGYRDKAVPTIAKGTFPFRVSSPELSGYSDQKQLSAWAKDEMAFILQQGYMMGVDKKGKVLAPKQALTRAQFAVLLLRLLGEESEKKSGKTFSDVPANKWYSGDLARAAKLGITDRTSGRFEPERAITREEAAIMAANAGRLWTYGTAARMNFTDLSSLSTDSRHAIQSVYEHGIMTGSGGKFNPGKTLVREEAAAILARLHALLYANSVLY